MKSGDFARTLLSYKAIHASAFGGEAHCGADLIPVFASESCRLPD